MTETMPPTIVQLIASSGFYGAEKVVANICKTLAEHHVIVICMSRATEDTTPFKTEVSKTANVQFIQIEKSFFKAIFLLLKLRQIHPSLVIHAHGYKEIYISCFFRIICRCRIIVTQHGFTERNRKSKLYNTINKLCCRWGGVYRILSVSRQIYDVYQRFGVDKRRLLYRQNGILLSPQPSVYQRRAARITLAATLNLADNVAIILFAGRLSAEKDPLLFLAAFARLHARMPNSHGVIAGDGRLLSVIQQKITHLGLQNSVTLLGFVPEMKGLLLGSDILLLTSITEGTPMIVLEAMAGGTAVIASGVGDIPELLASGENGIVVHSREPQTYADHCLDILGDAQLKRKITENGRKTIEQHYNFGHQQDFYLQLYGKRSVTW